MATGFVVAPPDEVQAGVEATAIAEAFDRGKDGASRLGPVGEAAVMHAQFFKLLKKLSTTVLSLALALQLTLPRSPCRA